MWLNVDEQQVFVATGGRPPAAGRPTVVFVHGAGMDHSIWVLPGRWFARHGWNVLAPDLPGHGRSGGPPVAGITGIADWVARLLDAAGADQAAVAGHSMGSLIALEFAARHPARAQAIALLGCAVPMPVNEHLLAAAAANDPLAIDMLNIFGHARSALVGADPHIGQWSLGMGQALLERAAPGVIHTDLAACNDYLHGLDSAAKVACPAVLISGDRDLMTPARNAEALFSALPRGRRLRLSDCGHSMFSEQPDAMLDALIDALSEAGQPA